MGKGQPSGPRGVCVSFVGELSGAQDVLPISLAVGHKRLWPKAIFHRSLGSHPRLQAASMNRIHRPR